METAKTLVEINRRFYRHHAKSFDTSRRAPWPGWPKLLDFMTADPDPASPPLRVLDAGCGNGRFGHFLRAHWPTAIDYLGIDSSEALLRAARNRLDGTLNRLRLQPADLLATTTFGAAKDERFDLVVLFGVLHHIPAEKARLALLRGLAKRLAPGGVMAVSLWRFDRDPRLAAKTVGWDELASLEVDPAELETGDHLLTWAGDRHYPRYCHLTDEAEAHRLLSAIPLPCGKRFADDGSSGDRNHYLIFRRDRG